MAGLDKGKHPIRPGLSSSTFIPPTLDPAHHMSHFPPPNLLQIPGYGTVHTAPADPDTATTAFASPRPETAVLPSPDSDHGMWQQTDPLVSLLGGSAPGSVIQRSSGRVREETDPEAEADWARDHAQYRRHD